MAFQSELLTVNETAVEMNLSVGTIRAWLLSRKLGCVRLGKAVRIPRSEIQRLIDQGSTPARFGRR
jgi:excisionase family DNA binding protein